ncbi:MAG: shikimate kinase [Planctomycetaceae bacterium]|nr:shikimate kinase [Planctomycetaceae bacterium]
MVVTLIGYRGCGKSSVGRLLAQQLSWSFCDADVELETRAGKSIREIFATDGEDAFRDLEEETLADLVRRDRLVLAAGGGAVLRETTRTRFQDAGPVVWLTAPAETLYARIHADDTTGERRPDLTDRGGLEEVQTLLTQREPIYREAADLILETQGQELPEIVNELSRRLRGREDFPS